MSNPGHYLGFPPTILVNNHSYPLQKLSQGSECKHRAVKSITMILFEGLMDNSLTRNTSSENKENLLHGTFNNALFASTPL